LRTLGSRGQCASASARRDDRTCRGTLGSRSRTSLLRRHLRRRGRGWSRSRSRRPDHRARVEDARVLERLAGLDAELGDAFLDGLGGRLLRVGVRDGLVLAAGDVTAEAEDEELTVCGVGPSYPPVSGPGVVGVYVTSVGAVVDVCRANLGVLGCAMLAIRQLPSGCNWINSLTSWRLGSADHLRLLLGLLRILAIANCRVVWDVGRIVPGQLALIPVARHLRAGVVRGSVLVVAAVGVHGCVLCVGGRRNVKVVVYTCRGEGGSRRAGRCEWELVGPERKNRRKGGGSYGLARLARAFRVLLGFVSESKRFCGDAPCKGGGVHGRVTS
jgi:hypothetical protein